jgi:hypothetical protein
LSPPTHPTIPTVAQTAQTVAAQTTTIPKTHISAGQVYPLVFRRVLPGPLERVLARALTKIVITLDLDDAITPESTIARSPSTAHNLSIRRTAYLPYVAA